MSVNEIRPHVKPDVPSKGAVFLAVPKLRAHSPIVKVSPI